MESEGGDATRSRFEYEVLTGMLVMQLIGGVVIFLDFVLTRPSPFEPVFAVFLAFLILVSGAFVYSSAKIRVPLVILKIALCLLLRQHTPLPLFLLPAIGMELPAVFYRSRIHPLVWTTYACILGTSVFLLPGPLVPFFLGQWGLALSLAFGERRRATLAERQAHRIRDLERELAEVESKRSLLERAAAGQELLIKLQERERIARKLHDELGHTVTGSIMQLEAARLLCRDEPVRTEGIIGKVALTLREGLAAIRMSLKAIVPEVSLLGLQRLQGMLDAFEASHGRATSLETEGQVQAIPAPVWQAIEDNLREALTNMLKHSSGRSFSCRISVLNKMYRAEFRDDGVVGHAISKGMGLDGMEARTREAGGTLIIDTSLGFTAIMLFKKGEENDGHTDSDRG